MADLIRLEISIIPIINFTHRTIVIAIRIHRISWTFHDRFIAILINRTRVRTRPLFAFSSKLSKYPNIFKRFFLTFFDMTRGKERMWNGFEKFVSTGSVSRDKFHYSFFLCWIVWWSKSSDLNERSLFIVNISQHFFIHTYIVS